MAYHSENKNIESFRRIDTGHIQCKPTRTHSQWKPPSQKSREKCSVCFKRPWMPAQTAVASKTICHGGRRNKIFPRHKQAKRIHVPNQCYPEYCSGLSLGWSLTMIKLVLTWRYMDGSTYLSQQIKHTDGFNNKNHPIVSIETEKAFDKIQQGFMIKALDTIGLDGRYLWIVKVVYDKRTPNSILNGENPEATPLKSGL